MFFVRVVVGFDLCRSVVVLAVFVAVVGSVVCVLLYT